MIMKRLISIILTVVLVIGFAKYTAYPASAQMAQVQIIDDDFEFFVIDNKAVIIDYIGNDVNVTIPETLGGYPVTELFYQIFPNSGIHSLTIPKSVTHIEQYALYNCSDLKEIIVDPDNSVYSSYDGALFDKNITSLISYPNGKAGSYHIPDSVRSIADSAFMGCSVLNEVIIPDSVISIGNAAFYGCSALSSINIPDSITYIGINTFSDCTALREVIIPDSVIYIDREAFARCGNLAKVTIPGTVKEIQADSFASTPWYEKLTDEFVITGDGVLIKYNGSADDIIIPDSVRYISRVFDQNITEITIPSTVIKIGSNAFAGCPQLEKVVIREGVKEIGYSAFSNCRTLNEIIIPSTIERIGSTAFFGCKQLEKVIICDGVKEIGEGAFEECANLKQAVIPVSVTTIGEFAFHMYDYYGMKPIPNLTIYADKGSEGYNFAKKYGFKNYSIAYYDGKIPFTDVNKEAWYFTYVRDVYYKGYFSGTSETSFAPDSPMTRAMFVTVLAKIEVADLRRYTESHFNDVETGKWYSAPVEWAYQSGIGSGTGEGNFSPEQYITREQMCLMLIRYAEYLGFDTKCIIDPDFKDSDKISKWAFDAVGLAAEYDLVAGRGNNTFAPGDYATRAEAAVIFLNFINCFISTDEFPAIKGESIFTIENGELTHFWSDEKRIDVPQEVTVIGENTFKDNTYITAIKLPEGLKRIEDNAFKGCRNLKTVILPSSLEYIGNFAFSNCSSLEYITPIPGGVKSINERAFFGCAQLKTLSITKGVVSIGKEAFTNCHAISELTLPSTLTDIGESAFSCCSLLSSVTIQGKATLSAGSFEGCRSLTKVDFKNDPVSVGENCFYQCSFLMDIKPDNLDLPKTALDETPLGDNKAKFDNKSILVIGNSYIDTSELYNNIQNIAQAANVPLIAECISIGYGDVNQFASDPYLLNKASSGNYDYIFLCGFYDKTNGVESINTFLDALNGTDTKLVMFPAHNETEPYMVYENVREKVDLLDWKGLIDTLIFSGINWEYLKIDDTYRHANDLNGYAAACMIYSYLYDVMPDNSVYLMEDYFKDRVPSKNIIEMITVYAYWYAKEA